MTIALASDLWNVRRTGSGPRCKCAAFLPPREATIRAVGLLARRETAVQITQLLGPGFGRIAESTELGHRSAAFRRSGSQTEIAGFPQKKRRSSGIEHFRPHVGISNQRISFNRRNRHMQEKCGLGVSHLTMASRPLPELFFSRFKPQMLAGHFPRQAGIAKAISTQMDADAVEFDGRRKTGIDRSCWPPKQRCPEGARAGLGSLVLLF